MMPTTRFGSLGLLALLGLATASSAGPIGKPDPHYPPLPRAVTSFGAVACDGFIYAYGGHTGTAHSYSSDTSAGTFQRLPVGGGTEWEQLPGGPGLIGMNLASTGGKVYRVGGMHAKNKRGEKADLVSVADVAVYDPKAKAWSPFVPLPSGRSSHDVVAVGSKLVVVGGWEMQGTDGKSKWADAALICDTAAKQPKWEEVAQPFRRRALAAAAVGDKVYVLGGLTESAETVRTVDVLDLASRKWSSVPEFPGTARTGFNPAACEIGGRLYLNTLDRSVLRLNDKGDGWDKVGATVETRYVHRLVPVGPSAFVAVAGASPKGPHASLELVKVDGAAAGGTPAAADPKPNKQKFCPIMTTDEVDPENSTEVEYKGVKILLCCDTCVAKFKRDPAAYLDPKLIPALAEKELPKRGIEQVYCPVYPERKVSARDPFVTYKGVKVYVFNEVAKQRFLKDPARYADPKILPQLPKEK